MNSSGLNTQVEKTLSGYTDQEVTITGESHLGGGCINNAQRIDTSVGPFFLKHNPSPLPRMFEREAEGLRALHAVGEIAVPEPIAFSNGGSDHPPFLLTTYIATGRKASGFSEDFGRRFARMHKNGTGKQFGFDNDNYIGATPQPNGWMDNWVEFFRVRRLGFQLKLAEKNGFGGELQRSGGKLLDKLDQLIATPDEPPTLLHGDLWGGNYMVGSDGQAFLIDPAVYYGHREADLAMTHLFGGFDSTFYRAYNEEYPLAPGSSERQEIYTLYHLLNHLNLFGGGYLDGCLSIIGRFV
jgi:fructosamine-3-kinase